MPTWVLAGLLAGAVVRAELQFDVFVGYGSSGAGDGLVREGGWFPVACEVYNDGPGFDAVFELSSRQLGGGQVRRLALELPTNTRKRFSFPMFAGARYTTWEARLLDAKGRVQARREELRTREVGWETYLLGALAASPAGQPAFPTVKHNRTEQHPAVARLTLEQFPENPIALEGLNAIYLNSARAPELRVPQAQALVAWVLGGGHLIVAPDQLTDISGTPWLAELLPVEWGELTLVRAGSEVHQWVMAGSRLTPAAAQPGAMPTPGTPSVAPNRPRTSAQPGVNPYERLQPEAAFAGAELPVFRVRPRAGQVRLAAGDLPLVVTWPHGRGQVTLLTFNPEREPFRGWANRAWFWARLCDLPGEWFAETARNLYGGWSLDAVYGAMIETRQVRKLPVEWLLALLVVYLGVIGPFDRWFLKKINRQMLTWVTFPAYVVLFSLLIYYIGYRLRAGETEWGELHVVDVLPRGEQALLRGRTYGSIYSPANVRYRLGSDLPTAALRSEFLGPAAGGQESGRLEATLKPSGLEAGVAVPVWSSLLVVGDWAGTAAPPFTATPGRNAAGQPVLIVQNRLPRPLADVVVVADQRVYPLGELAAGARREIELDPTHGRSLSDVVGPQFQRFVQAAQRRQRAFGSANAEFLEPTTEVLLGATFLSRAPGASGPGVFGTRSFVYPAGLELGELLARGQAVVLARDPDQAPPGGALARFKAPRTSRLTWWRLAVPGVTRG